MSRELIHIYGPFSIQSFGLIVAIGLSLFLWLVYKNPKRKKLISDEQFSTLTFIGIVAGIVGGRLFFVAQEYQTMSFVQMLSFWEGGFSILGTIICTLLAIVLYLKRIRVPIFPFLDLIAIYAPLAQSISRIGCFVAGCCYGTLSNLPWAVCPKGSLAPLHPTQLYSSLFLFLIFLFMRFVATKFCKKPGQLISLYVALAGFERFFIGFWRGDNEYFGAKTLQALSIHQWIGLLLTAAGLIIFFCIPLFYRRRTQ